MRPNSFNVAVAETRLAPSLRLRAVAKGVETEAQLQVLEAQECDEIQRDYVSRCRKRK